MEFDATGKVSLEHIYTQPDPRAYFRTLRVLDYHIPQLAKPYFSKVADECRETRPGRPLRVLDVGCSYGINAALLKLDVSMDELYDRYDGTDVGRSRAELVARDRALARDRGGLHDVEVIGLDTSQPALAYAYEAGFLDGAVHADLETRDLTEPERALLADVDLVVSTGCLGYVTDRTLARIVAAVRDGGRRPLPWMAHFALRMFPFDPIAELLAGYGYQTEAVGRLFEQRRFVSPREQEQVLATLAGVGVDPAGLEADGWLYARLFVSRPPEPDPGVATL
ncbi:class I SAM-dependent methyltransferase [Parafrankia sp. EUN1f]|uniref:class I SAM-dependent methyltransferase n=1 Tax=Parafrankia sp. EUN1f TaxID=102897 RepID=UPI0001C449BD|nr:class I SAM-dependent methyltransferase [Parafrankia sp. EUN1f]EFC85676.1 Methyltransferase type 12 [Parafrankia sp. EUN1f]